MLADTGGDRRGINWAAGQGRAGLGNALDGGGIGRDEPLLVFAACVASCVSCSVCSSALHPMHPVDCPALQRTAYASKWERSIAAGEWLDGPASAWELHGSHLCCVQNLLGCIRPGCLSGIYWVRSLVRGTPRKGLD